MVYTQTPSEPLELQATLVVYSAHLRISLHLVPVEIHPVILL